MIDSDAIDFHELACDGGQSLAEDQGAYRIVRPPQIHHLQEGPGIRVTFLHGKVHRIQLDHFGGDGLSEMLQLLRRKNLLELYESPFSIESDLFFGYLIRRGVEVQHDTWRSDVPDNMDANPLLRDDSPELRATGIVLGFFAASILWAS